MMSGLRRHEEEVRVEPGAEQQEMVCSKCGEMIVGRAMKVSGERSMVKMMVTRLQAGDRYWHERCFTCSDCGIRLRDTKVNTCK